MLRPYGLEATDRADDAVRAPFFSCPVRGAKGNRFRGDAGRGRTRSRWGADSIRHGLRRRARLALPGALARERRRIARLRPSRLRRRNPRCRRRAVAAARGRRRCRRAVAARRSPAEPSQPAPHREPLRTGRACRRPASPTCADPPKLCRSRRWLAGASSRCLPLEHRRTRAGARRLATCRARRGGARTRLPSDPPSVSGAPLPWPARSVERADAEPPNRRCPRPARAQPPLVELIPEVLPTPPKLPALSPSVAPVLRPLQLEPVSAGSPMNRRHRARRARANPLPA